MLRVPFFHVASNLGWPTALLISTSYTTSTISRFNFRKAATRRLMEVISSSPSVISVPTANKCCCVVSSLAFELFCTFSAFLLALVFSILGAIAGAVGGLKSGSGFLHGSAIGTIIGFILSSHISAFSYDMWDFNDFKIGFFLPFMETTSTALKGRLAQHSATTIPVLPVDQAESREIQGNGSSQPEVVRASSSRNKIRKVRLTPGNVVVTLRSGDPCSICLQDFELNDYVSVLPECRHVFHPSCIRRWIAKRKSCPLCRSQL